MVNSVFDIKSLLSQVDTDDFSEKCKSYAGGATTYNDSKFGEQGFFYSFRNKKLKIEIIVSEIWCKSKDCFECSCEDDAHDEFETWEEYWQAHTYKLIFTENQVKQIISQTQLSLF